MPGYPANRFGCQLTSRDWRSRTASASNLSDSGVGIDPKEFDKLFNACYTTKSHGMMGFSISRSIIENHKGRLWASTNNGHAATFAFSIPCQSA
jgi:signal transduction histidine kinase